MSRMTSMYAVAASSKTIVSTCRRFSRPAFTPAFASATSFVVRNPLKTDCRIEML